MPCEAGHSAPYPLSGFHKAIVELQIIFKMDLQGVIIAHFST